MKELQSIVTAYREVAQKGIAAALATVMKVTGSAYRRAGARLLITADGRTVGSVSGGCLERDVFNHARRVLQWNEPRVVTYDSMSDEDIAWEFGLGCNGIVEILIEPLPLDGKQGHMTFLADCLFHRRMGVIATVFGVAGDTTAKVGNRLLLNTTNPVRHDIGDDELVDAIFNDSWHALNSGRSQTKTYETATSHAEVCIEVVQPPVPLVICGAGPDAIPVVRLAKELGWHVTLVDPRPGYAIPTRFPLADRFIVCQPEEVCERVAMDDRTVVTIMTHNVLHDSALLRALWSSPIRYLGLLGPKRRTQRLLDESQTPAFSLTENHLGRLHGPIGLDIGAETPEEIALAVIAEIKAVLAGRSGGMLRVRQAPLHEPGGAVDVVMVSGKINGTRYCGLQQ